MFSSNLNQWGVLGALLAGIAWIAAVIVDLASADQQGAVLMAIYIIAWVGTLGGLVGLYALQAPNNNYGWLGITGFFAAFIGATLSLAGTALTLLFYSGILQQEFLGQTLGLGLFTTFVGIVLFGAGLVLLGLATVLRRTMPLWLGVVLMVALPVVWVLGNYAGGIVLGIVWLAVAYALWSAKQASQVGQRYAHVS